MAALEVIEDRNVTRKEVGAWITSAGVATALVLVSGDANAYRPFDGTDADVAEHGEFELELGPAQLLRIDHQSFLQAPSTVLNYGVIPGWEIVADLRNQIPLEGGHVALVDNDLLVKTILKEGSLQEGHTGLSIATEFGVLFPSVPTMTSTTSDAKRFGLADNVIVSYRLPFLTAHLNSQIELDRVARADWFESLIVEGPWRWPVRPVAEGMLEKEWRGTFTRSILAGVIGRASDSFYLDAALRVFHQSDDAIGTNGYEIRFGLTWAIPILHPTRVPEAEPEGEHAFRIRADPAEIALDRR